MNRIAKLFLMAAVVFVTMATITNVLNPVYAYADQTDPKPRPDGAAVAPDTVTAACGNGIVEAPETCDDKNLVDGDGCDKNCKIEVKLAVPVCGDGKIEAPEVCDDGNTADGDLCSADCKTANPAKPEPEDVAVKGDMVAEGDMVTEGDATVKGDVDVEGSLNVTGDANVTNMRVQRMIFEEETKLKDPFHRLGIMVGFASCLGDPYSVNLKVRYDPMWVVSGETMIGFRVEAGGGFWARYNGEGGHKAMIPMAALFQVGNTRGGGAFGVEAWSLAPMDGHRSDESWELVSFVRLGAYVTHPRQDKEDGFLAEFFVGIPFYKPLNSNSPHFDAPLFIAGVSIGYAHTWAPGGSPPPEDDDGGDGGDDTEE